MKFDLHIHSKYSYDSILSPEKIIKIAKKKGLNGVAVTDHNTIRGGIETLKTNNDPDFQVIVGAEIRTEYGDILGLFLNEEIKSRKFEEVIDEIRAQGGLSVLAHPYRKYKSPEKLINKVDLIEAFNARSRREENKKAYELAIKFKKPITAGSDAHLPFEIGNGKIVLYSGIKNLLKSKKIEVLGKESNYFLVHGLTVMIEKIRKFWIF